MDDTQPKLELGPEEHRYTFPPAVPCPECGGKGSILLLTSARACGACEGAGQVLPEPRHEVVPGKLGYWRRERSYDEQGRVIRETTWFEEASPPGGKLEERSPLCGKLEIRNPKLEINPKSGGNE